MRKLGVVFLVVWATWLFSEPAFAIKRVALVIGNSAYERVARLDNPTNDATAITETLKGAGFDVVESRRDLKIADMRRVLRDFSDKSRDADVAVVFYAGHGVEVEGTNYLIPVDATLERDLDVYDEAIPLDRILVMIEPAKQLRLVILDACRDNPFSKTMKRTVASRAVSRGLAKVEPTSPNTLIAFASKAGSTASDGDSKNSPFTVALLKYITRPGLDLRRAFGFVRDDVMKRTGNRQEPYVYGSLGGDDVSLVPLKPITSDSSPGRDLELIRRDYELALQVGTKAAWGSFLNTYTTGFYADLAREQLDKPVAAEISANGQKPQQVASRPSESSAGLTALSEVEVARSVQVELRRVGCLAGSINDEWTAASRRSLELFNQHAGTKLDAKLASLSALDVVKSKSARVCPLSCDRGYKVDGEHCTKITCGAHFFVNGDNECERKREKPLAAREETPKREKPGREQVQPEPAAKPQASGRVFCGQAGCRPVRPGCRIGRSPKPWVTDPVEVCH